MDDGVDGWMDGWHRFIFITHTKCVCIAWRWGLIFCFHLRKGPFPFATTFFLWRLPGPWKWVDTFYLIKGCSLRLTWFHGLLVCHGNILGTFLASCFLYFSLVRSLHGLYSFRSCVVSHIRGLTGWVGNFVFSFHLVGLELCNKWSRLVLFFSFFLWEEKTLHQSYHGSGQRGGRQVHSGEEVLEMDGQRRVCEEGFLHHTWYV